jgi:hypothetical protein
MHLHEQQLSNSSITEHSPPAQTHPIVFNPPNVVDQALTSMNTTQFPSNGEPQQIDEPHGLKTSCLYHGPSMDFVPAQSSQELSSLDRFLVEGPTEQYAVFMVGHHGQLSIDKGCTCENIGPDLEISDDEDAEAGHNEVDVPRGKLGEAPVQLDKAK